MITKIDIRDHILSFNVDGIWVEVNCCDTEQAERLVIKLLKEGV
ncbi:hypothetical protein SAMN05446037_1006148 [Anaerovirgula multivorans]|uniref:Uncharacterized protein n=1 Tax=Anaerovirgula multivorans TaxID=312168 RepID=A0A239CV37_9FIRM|nr:hypothetical protein [Anaerovirgula multivorans]SNS23521.1 hypothetical protein SAMN05446037_1006148 [Anaerovirgula multivorans]